MNIHTPFHATSFQWEITTGPISHLMAISHFVQKKAMEELTEKRGYGKLSLAFSDYMAKLIQRDCSPGELARELRVSKQACSKTIREMTALGLLDRKSNPTDSRSSILFLTSKGRQLIVDGHAASTEIYCHLAHLAGNDNMDGLVASLSLLCRELDVAVPNYQPPPPSSGAHTVQAARFNLLLHSLAGHCYQYLIRALSDKGFSGLKSSFSQVLSLIIPDGGRIQHIASVVGVSKQAIAATATELEQLGYIVRDSDPDDRRQVILRLSPLGERLLSAASAAVQLLENSFLQALGTASYAELEKTLATLYFEALDHYRAAGARTVDIQALSQQLLQQLGVSDARELACHLMILTRGDS